MKLISIKLCNFRQFYGTTPEITLASGDRNTTLIHGNNGSGKTTLLNTFTWVLYERFTAAFASPNLLINKRAITEAQVGASVECWAEIYFEHQNKRYQLKRKCYAYREPDNTIQYSQTKFFMTIAQEDGRWYLPTEQPHDIINQILPESLHQYFFFDGEHIDHIFRSKEKNTIAEDTKELLGVKIFDRAIDHLKKVIKTLENELNIIGDVETKQLLKHQAKLENEREELIHQKQENLKQLAQLATNKKETAKQLLELSGAEELKQAKENLEKQEKFLQSNLLESKTNLRALVSSSGYMVFLKEMITQFNLLISDLRQRGELPSGIKQQFVQQLLEQKQCICGNELTEETIAYHHVKEWMNKAGIAEVEESAIRLESQVNEIDKQVVDFWLNVDREQEKITKTVRELSRVERDLDNIKDKLRHYPNEDIQGLQKQLDKNDQLIREFHLEQGATQQQIDALNQQIEEINKQLIKHQKKEKKQTLAKHRIAATQEARERLIEVRSRLEKQFRLSLEKRVQEIFSSISFTPYIPRLDTNYELNLVERTSGIAVTVAASTGENQILSLSFISGIIDRVREWSQKHTLMGFDSSTFPIVMDSPFGSLDEIYRRQVAKSIPTLANQLIILVTKTQWRGEVEEETANYIGKEYVLVYYSPKPNCKEDSINLGGINYPLVKQSPNEFEYSEVVEVTREKEHN